MRPHTLIPTHLLIIAFQLACSPATGATNAQTPTSPHHSRFGLNVSQPSLAPRLQTLGIGWVRFENLKWPFVSPAPHTYAFDGSVSPWHVNTDTILQAYRSNNLQILSYMFLTPEWASTAPPDTPPNRILTFPPTDPALFGEFCFQVAARYGNTSHPAEKLLTQDKQSGLGLVHHFEMWNEPGLNPRPDATWGGWSAPLKDYYRMMRHGAEAIKQADPTAQVTSAGYAGIAVETVDHLRTYTYPDGKHPLDFIDILSVHYYSGLEPPETARGDGNSPSPNGLTLESGLKALTAWRDQHAPNLPIWLTETGYDSAGPFGTTEDIQAARLPRMVMLALAFGIDKVFVYRESGSTPTKHACSGLLRNDLSEKPSWTTYATLINQFTHVHGGATRLPHPNPNVWLLQWQSNHHTLITAWTTQDTTPLLLDLPAHAITNAFGQSLPTHNTTQLELSTYPTYIHQPQP